MDGDIIPMALEEDIIIITMVDVADLFDWCFDLSISCRSVARSTRIESWGFVIVTLAFYFLEYYCPQPRELDQPVVEDSAIRHVNLVVGI